jgi:hypothetical protein
MPKYQIVVLQSFHKTAYDRLRESITQRLTELGLPPNTYEFFDDTTAASREDTAITVAIYLGLSHTSPTANPTLVDLLERAVLVIPIVSSTVDVKKQLPPELCHFNAMEWKSDELSALKAANISLEALSLLRSTRRLFISYRRAETTGIAIQLFEFFESHGFDVFLDTHSVPVGEPFQDILWHRLCDSDLIVVLDSPDFMNSFWTMEEVTRANSTSVEIVQVIWPGANLLPEHALNHPFPLDRGDIRRRTCRLHQRLTANCLNRLITSVESVRARALAARHSYLVAEFMHEANLLGKKPRLLTERFMTIELANGNLIAAVPAVGVPTAKTCHDVEVEMQKHSTNYEGIVLLYDERGILTKWISHLSWLNGYKLRVQSLQISEAASWMQGVN